MKVFKFGGASVKDADAVRNVAKVLGNFANENVLIVISAMGKTTNLLEKLVDAYFNRTDAKYSTLEEIKQFHYNIIDKLLPQTQSHAFDDIENIFIELECLLEAEPDNNYDYHYDQIVSYGEILSTKIVSTYLNEAGLKNRWMDAQNFISTDNTYREGKVNWSLTNEKIAKTLKPIVQKKMVITQGFIGRSSVNTTVTLGREGSDYSAAIFAFCLDAESVTIWKDVAGVMNADPKRFAEAVKISGLSYNKAIEMAFYGATVIHPKTIQPLLNKEIPLYVKSFINPSDEGTTVGVPREKEDLVPTYIFKQNQMLISIASKDFSFIVEENLSSIFSLFASYRVKINVMQNSAISFTVCVDYNEHKCNDLINELEQNYRVKSNSNLELLTISNYESAETNKFTEGKKILLEQRNRRSLQLVLA
jgi:aspartate kinase